MEYGIIVTAMSLFGTFALVLADVTSEPDHQEVTTKTAQEAEERLAA